jgi:hypothetical protein
VRVVCGSRLGIWNGHVHDGRLLRLVNWENPRHRVVQDATRGVESDIHLLVGVVVVQNVVKVFVGSLGRLTGKSGALLVDLTRTYQPGIFVTGIRRRSRLESRFLEHGEFRFALGGGGGGGGGGPGLFKRKCGFVGVLSARSKRDWSLVESVGLTLTDAWVARADQSGKKLNSCYKKPFECSPFAIIKNQLSMSIFLH